MTLWRPSFIEVMKATPPNWLIIQIAFSTFNFKGLRDTPLYRVFKCFNVFVFGEIRIRPLLINPFDKTVALLEKANNFVDVLVSAEARERVHISLFFLNPATFW